MDPFVNEKDFMLLNQDHYTFSVLMRILKGDCEIIRSNHENLLLCHSASHYPARKAMHCCNQNLTRHMSFQLCIDTASPEDTETFSNTSFTSILPLRQHRQVYHFEITQ